MSIRENLEEIKRKRGALMPEYVVEAAEDKNHPLHDRFEWDDSIAGPAYRKEQARKIITEVEISYTKNNGEKGRARAFYAIKKENVYEYESTEEIVSDPISREILLSSMQRDWEDLRDRYDQLTEFWELVNKDKETKDVAGMVR